MVFPETFWTVRLLNWRISPEIMGILPVVGRDTEVPVCAWTLAIDKTTAKPTNTDIFLFMCLLYYFYFISLSKACFRPETACHELFEAVEGLAFVYVTEKIRICYIFALSIRINKKRGGHV